MFMRMVYDEKLAQAAYLIGCQRSGEAIVIDPLRDVDRYVQLAEANGLRIVAVAETHIHADFVSGARELAERYGAKVYVSAEGGPEWQSEWLDHRMQGGAYDHRRLRDGETFAVGNIDFRVVHTPGHTPEHIALLVTDRGGGANAPMGLLSGDFVFVGDLGRPDLLETAAGESGAMEPSARRLFKSIRRLQELPDFVQVWPAHGAGSACGKALGAVPQSTIGYERRFNASINAARNEDDFVRFILSGQPEPPLYFANMKRLNKVGPPVLGPLEMPRRISASELRALDARRVAIIDTRTWDEFRGGHVPGALSLPLTRSFSTDAGSLVRASEEIFLIVPQHRLDEAVRDLLRIGLDSIRGWFDPADMAEVITDGGALSTLPEVPAEVARKLVGDGETRLLDVRRLAEFAEGHVPGAINIALTRLAARLEELPRGGRILVNCRSGARSARAAAFLQRHGFEVMNMRGGMLAWEAIGAPIERSRTT